ncbi:spindle and kinetochore-associated protein 3 isoform X2 [Hyperolius riggenbachi]
MGLKSDVQGLIDKNIRKGDELNSFIKICKVLQRRSASDIQQVKETFQKYGYTAPDANTSDRKASSDSADPEGTDEQSDPVESPPLPAPQKQAAWELRAPQLSDFGLSHYQLPTAWEPVNERPQMTKVPEEKPKPLYKDIRTLNVAKTPKCALTEEADFSQIEHFGINDYSTNLNDDYTMALINKKKGSAAETRGKESSQSLRSMLATPAHLKYRHDYSSLDSPLPPNFCTPGLKVQKKTVGEAVKTETSEQHHHEGIAVCDNVPEESDYTRAVPPFQTLSRDITVLDSPHPPTFCTPGLKVQKKTLSSVVEKPSEDKVVEKMKIEDALPPPPSFETRWLNADSSVLDITDPIPRPEMSHVAFLDVPRGLNTDKYGNPEQTTSPPKIRDLTIGTPPRPEMTMSLTADVFKYNMKLASPPKVSVYENLLWTPVRPEMTSCITEDVSQLLTHYCDNKTKLSWEDPQGMFVRRRNEENKENRP